jgi:hypothetical protein
VVQSARVVEDDGGLVAESSTAVTERINAAPAAAGADDLNDVAALHGRQTLQDTDDDW